MKNISQVLGLEKHSLALAASRSSLIYARVKLSALVLAFLMIAWVPIDLYILGFETVYPLIYARLLVAVLLISVAYMKLISTNLRKGEISLFFLILLIMAFFSFANFKLQSVDWSTADFFIKGAYAHLPILILMLLCLFPLTVIESSFLFVFVFMVTLGFVFNPAAPAYMLFEMGTLWILWSVGFLAIIASSSLLYYVLKLIEVVSLDDMTGCYRRDQSNDILETLFKVYKRKKEPLTVLFIDLDNFKSINDDFGHEAGDQVLINAAQAFKETLRKQDIIVRWGGEEFLLVCPGLQLGDLNTVLERLSENGIGQRPDNENLTASCGASELLKDQAADIMDLISKADQRMYKAKQKGRNLVYLGPNNCFQFLKNR